MIKCTKKEAVNIGKRREVFWDNYLLDKSRTTAEFRVHQPRMEEEIMLFDQPWESDGTTYHQIIKDGDLYRMYYGANPVGGALDWTLSVLCYAESKDGIHWERPNLGIRQYEDSYENNIIMNREQDGFCDSRYIYVDENPNCPPEEKYKAIGLKPFVDAEGDEPLVLMCNVSADGIHFNKGWEMSDKGNFDTHNVVFWVPEENQYVAYIRCLHCEVPGYVGIDGWIRDIRRMTSPDFRNWSEPEMLDYQGGDDYPLYTNVIQRYTRAPHMYIGFPARYVERPQWTGNYDQLAGVEARKARCALAPRLGLATTDSVFMCSRDGLSFRRYDEAFLTPGIEREINWMYGNCYISSGMVETESAWKYAPTEYSLFTRELVEGVGVGGSYLSSLRRYSIRKDGFVSMYAPYGERKIYTVPLTFEGSKMELNFSTSAKGYVYVRIIGCEGEPLTSCELFGDTLDRIVPFNGDLSQFAGKNVVLEFTLSDADVYSYRFFD